MATTSTARCRKSDGAWTYFAPDIAYHHDKIERGFEELIDVFGADHGGYVKRMQAAVSALSDGAVPLDVKLAQLVRLMKGGEPVKMSKRSGNFVSLREIVDEVGPDVVRFHMLTRKNDAPLDFDFDRVTEQSKDNPVFYVQYAHARVRSLWRKAESLGIMTTDVPLLEDEAEVAVAKKISEWPRLVEIAARNHEPHRVAFYLYELASAFHALWNKGNDRTELRFIQRTRKHAPRQKWHWPAPLPLSFRRDWVSSASLLRKRCADARTAGVPEATSSHRGASA